MNSRCGVHHCRLTTETMLAELAAMTTPCPAFEAEAAQIRAEVESGEIGPDEPGSCDLCNGTNEVARFPGLRVARSLMTVLEALSGERPELREELRSCSIRLPRLYGTPLDAAVEALYKSVRA